MTRPRLALLERVAQDIRSAARRRRRPRESQRTDEEFARRLDATRERLRREIPPRADDA